MLVRIFVVFMTLSVCVHLYAGTPFITDDPGFVGKGQWEIKFETLYERHRDAAPDVITAPLDINYSVIDHLKLNLTLNERTIITPRGTTYSGAGDIDFKFKYRFLDEDEKTWKPALSIAPDVTISAGWGTAITVFECRFNSGRPSESTASSRRPVTNFNLTARQAIRFCTALAFNTNSPKSSARESS